MSTLRVTNIQHPNAVDPAIELDPVDGVVFSAASFDADAIVSGTLDAARVPNLAASKITSGTFTSARLPAGSIIAVKDAIKTNTFVSSSINAGASVAVPGLSVTHALANANNKLIISAFFGVANHSADYASVGIAVNDSVSGFIGVGNASGVRTRVSAGGYVSGSPSGVVRDRLVTMPSITFVYAPGNTTSRTYEVHAFNVFSDARTLYINRPWDNINNPTTPAAISALVIQEVKV